MKNDIEAIKRRFSIIGNHPALMRAVEVAYQVASTDLSVLVQGESGSGKEFFPKIVHSYSARKHGTYIAVNCGAIPEGTIDSELFGHVKGAFTGAHDNRSGYFEETNGGTLFLDEVAELPMATQARLLRVLESGEFIRVGSSKVQKTDVRVIAATNVNLADAISKGKFREDLYYRLSAVPIRIPPLRERGEDALLLFRHFANEFAEKYRMPPIHLTPEAQRELLGYPWPGNVRQLKNVTEQVSIMEQEREVTPERLMLYLHGPGSPTTLPMLYQGGSGIPDCDNHALYELLVDMRVELRDLRALVMDMVRRGSGQLDEQFILEHARALGVLGTPMTTPVTGHPAIREAVPSSPRVKQPIDIPPSHYVDPTEVIEEDRTLVSMEEEAIRAALSRNGFSRKDAAAELGISQRTLYRRLKEYGIQI